MQCMQGNDHASAPLPARVYRADGCNVCETICSLCVRQHAVCERLLYMHMAVHGCMLYVDKVNSSR